MTEKPKLRLQLNIDVTLDFHEYNGGDENASVDKIIGEIMEQTETSYDLARFLQDWSLLEGGDLQVRIVER